MSGAEHGHARAHEYYYCKGAMHGILDFISVELCFALNFAVHIQGLL